MTSVRRILLLLLAYTCLSLRAMPVPHAYHVSLTQIAYNADTDALEIAVKIFTDDLEATLEALGAPRLLLNSPREHAEAQTLIARYLDNRLAWTVNDSPKTAKYIGREYEDDATWCYLEILDIPEFRSITLGNAILMERFEDQSNLVHVTHLGRTQSLFFTATKSTGSLNF
jgi:hypothetical protein